MRILSELNREFTNRTGALLSKQSHSAGWDDNSITIVPFEDIAFQHFLIPWDILTSAILKVGLLNTPPRSTIVGDVHI